MVNTTYFQQQAGDGTGGKALGRARVARGMYKVHVFNISQHDVVVCCLLCYWVLVIFCGAARSAGVLPDAFVEELPGAVRKQQQQQAQDTGIHAGHGQQPQGSPRRTASRSAATSAVSSISRSTAADSEHTRKSVCVDAPHGSSSARERNAADTALHPAPVLSDSIAGADDDQWRGAASAAGAVVRAGAEQGVRRGARSKARLLGLPAASERSKRATRAAQGLEAAVHQLCTRQGMAGS